MNLILAVRLAASLVMPSDTPPAPPLEKLFAMNTVEELVALTRLSNGDAAPVALVPPIPKNLEDVAGYILKKYPFSLRDADESQLGYVWLHINAHGLVTSISLISSTGHGQLDRVAVQGVTMLRFQPATLEGRSVGVWMPYPLEIGSYDDLLAWTERQGATRQSFRSYTLSPALMNSGEVRRAIDRLHPGVEATVTVWADLDAAGAMTAVEIAISSGNARADSAALDVARRMRFSPARNGMTAVPIRVRLPVVFHEPAKIPK